MMIAAIASSFATQIFLHPEESRRLVSKDDEKIAPQDEAIVRALVTV